MATTVESGPDSNRLVPAARIGALGGLGFVFVSTIGMVEAFGEKNVVDPILSLGYTVLIAIGLLVGYRSTLTVRESRSAPSLLAAGATAGLVGGLVAAVFVIFINTWEVRDVFTNISPSLIEALNLEGGVTTGIGLAVGGGLVTGVAGAGLALLSPLLRRAVVGALLWVLVVGFLEVILTQIFNEADLGIALAAVLVGLSLWLLLRFVGDRPV